MRQRGFVRSLSLARVSLALGLLLTTSGLHADPPSIQEGETYIYFPISTKGSTFHNTITETTGRTKKVPLPMAHTTPIEIEASGIGPPETPTETARLMGKREGQAVSLPLGVAHGIAYKKLSRRELRQLQINRDRGTSGVLQGEVTVSFPYNMGDYYFLSAREIEQADTLKGLPFEGETKAELKTVYVREGSTEAIGLFEAQYQDPHDPKKGYVEVEFYAVLYPDTRNHTVGSVTLGRFPAIEPKDRAIEILLPASKPGTIKKEAQRYNRVSVHQRDARQKLVDSYPEAVDLQGRAVFVLQPYHFDLARIESELAFTRRKESEAKAEYDKDRNNQTAFKAYVEWGSKASRLELIKSGIESHFKSTKQGPALAVKADDGEWLLQNGKKVPEEYIRHASHIEPLLASKVGERELENVRTPHRGLRDGYAYRGFQLPGGYQYVAVDKSKEGASSWELNVLRDSGMETLNWEPFTLLSASRQGDRGTVYLGQEVTTTNPKTHRDELYRIRRINVDETLVLEGAEGRFQIRTELLSISNYSGSCRTSLEQISLALP